MNTRYLSWIWLLWLLSPTRAIVDICKSKCLGNKFTPRQKGNILRCFSCLYFGIDVVLLLLLSLLFNRTLFSTPSGNIPCTLHSLLLYFAFSRIIEIIYAFVSDAWDSINSPRPKNSNLSASERIKFLLRSYFGLITNFAILYYFLPFEQLFENELCNFYEAVFYSAASIAAYNLEDLAAMHAVSKFLTLIEIFSGIFMLTFAIAVYFSELSSHNKQ